MPAFPSERMPPLASRLGGLKDKTALLLSDHVPKLADALDLHDDLVARLEPAPLLLGQTEDHAVRCAREDDVAGIERHALRDIADDGSGREDHVRCPPVLAHLAVDERPNGEMRDIDLSGGHDIRTERREAVGRLAEQPLRGAALQVPPRSQAPSRPWEDAPRRLKH